MPLAVTTVTGGLSVPLALTSAVVGLNQPVFLTHAGNGSGDLFIVERPGRIRRRVPQGQVITFLDITASHENRDTILDVVARTAEQCFMPLTVGGGVRTLSDIRRLLLAGAVAVQLDSIRLLLERFYA